MVERLAAGCGGGGGGGGGSSTSPGIGGAAIIPASAPLVLAVDTDFGSSQVKTLQGLIDKFPGKDRLYATLQRSLTKQNIDFTRDVEPALGPETDVVVLSFENLSASGSNVVLLTKPD